MLEPEPKLVLELEPGFPELLFGLLLLFLQPFVERILHLVLALLECVGYVRLHLQGLPLKLDRLGFCCSKALL